MCSNISLYWYHLILFTLFHVQNSTLSTIAHRFPWTYSWLFLIGCSHNLLYGIPQEHPSSYSIADVTVRAIVSVSIVIVLAYWYFET